MLPIRTEIIRGLLWQVEIDAKNSRTGNAESLSGWSGSCLLRSRDEGYEDWSLPATVTIGGTGSDRVLVSLAGVATAGIQPRTAYGLVRLTDATGESQPFRLIQIRRIIDESEIG